MKSFKSQLPVMLILLVTVPSVQASSSGWSASSFEDAERLAKQRGVPLMVHFHASWCGPCQRMEQDVFSKSGVQSALNTGLVSVKVDSDSRRDLATRFGISSLPSDVFVMPDGRIATFVGASTRTTFLSRLNQFATPLGKATVASTAAKTIPNGAKARAISEPAKPRAALVLQSSDSRPETGPNTSSEVDAFDESILKASSADNVGDVALSDQDAVVSSSDGSVKKENGKQPRSALQRVATTRLGIDGFSPVALTDAAKWQRGQEDLTHEYQGVSYRFANAAELKRFKATPEKYVPVLHGCDPVAFVKSKRIEAGIVELGTVYQNRIFFFVSEETRAEFRQNPTRFARSMELTFFESSSPKEG